MKANKNGLLTVKEAALELRLHPQTVYRLLRKGEVAGEQVGKSWRVRLGVKKQGRR